MNGRWPGRCCAGLLWLLAAVAGAEELRIVGSRQPYLIQPLLDVFQGETGIHSTYRYIEAKALVDELQAAREQPVADVVVTADVGMIAGMLDADLLQPIASPILNTLIPLPFRDSQNRWFGFSMHARVIIYNPARLQPSANFSYSDLASPQFRGRLCMRSSSHVYNQSLIAAFIEHWGMEKTRAWVQGVADNLAGLPAGGDRDQIQAVASGQCDLTLANTYYYAGMTAGTPEQRAVVEKVALLWPGDSDMHVHINLSVGAVLKAARQPQAAQKFLEFLAGLHAQRLFSELNHEYPVGIGIPISDRLLQMGPFRADQLPLTRLYLHRDDVKAIIAASRWR